MIVMMSSFGMSGVKVHQDKYLCIFRPCRLCTKYSKVCRQANSAKSNIDLHCTQKYRLSRPYWHKTEEHLGLYSSTILKNIAGLFLRDLKKIESNTASNAKAYGIEKKKKNGYNKTKNVLGNG